MKIVCGEMIYRQLSSWIRTEYKYEYKAGETRSLALLTQKKYVRKLIWDAYYKHKDGPLKAFFDCLTSNRSWLLSMEAEIERELTAVAFEQGKQLIESSVPLYPREIAEIVRAYALHSSSVGANVVGDITKKAVRQTTDESYLRAHAPTHSRSYFRAVIPPRSSWCTSRPRAAQARCQCYVSSSCRTAPRFGARPSRGRSRRLPSKKECSFSRETVATSVSSTTSPTTWRAASGGIRTFLTSRATRSSFLATCARRLTRAGRWATTSRACRRSRRSAQTSS